MYKKCLLLVLIFLGCHGSNQASQVRTVYIPVDYVYAAVILSLLSVSSAVVYFLYSAQNSMKELVKKVDATQVKINATCDEMQGVAQNCKQSISFLNCFLQGPARLVDQISQDVLNYTQHRNSPIPLSVHNILRLLSAQDTYQVFHRYLGVYLFLAYKAEHHALHTYGLKPMTVGDALHANMNKIVEFALANNGKQLFPLIQSCLAAYCQASAAAKRDNDKDFAQKSSCLVQ